MTFGMFVDYGRHGLPSTDALQVTVCMYKAPLQHLVQEGAQVSDWYWYLGYGSGAVQSSTNERTDLLVRRNHGGSKQDDQVLLRGRRRGLEGSLSLVLRESPNSPQMAGKLHLKVFSSDHQRQPSRFQTKSLRIQRQGKFGTAWSSQ